MSSGALTELFNSVPRRERIFRPILVVDDDPFRAFARCAALERAFYGVIRAASAADALIRMEEPALRGNLALVIAGLNQPGISGPAFVRELTLRLPHTPVLAIGQAGESTQDYAGANVRFLPQQTSPADILAAAIDMLSHRRAWVA